VTGAQERLFSGVITRPKQHSATTPLVGWGTVGQCGKGEKRTWERRNRKGLKGGENILGVLDGLHDGALWCRGLVGGGKDLHWKKRSAEGRWRG